MNKSNQRRKILSFWWGSKSNSPPFPLLVSPPLSVAVPRPIRLPADPRDTPGGRRPLFEHSPQQQSSVCFPPRAPVRPPKLQRAVPIVGLVSGCRQRSSSHYLSHFFTIIPDVFFPNTNQIIIFISQNAGI